MRFLGSLITLLIIALGVAFAALNAKSVEINYLTGTKELPLVVLMLIALILGMLLSMLIMGFNILKLKTKTKILESKLKRTQEEITHHSS